MHDESKAKLLLAAAKKAVLADKKVKLRARVNHEDNFAHFYYRVAHDAMMDVVCAKFDMKDKKARVVWIDWFNEASTTPASSPRQSCFDAIAYTAARAAYAKLHPERTK